MSKKADTVDFQAMHEKLIQGKAAFNPDISRLQQELLTAKLDVEELKAMLTSKDDELDKIQDIVKQLNSDTTCCGVSGAFLECYAAIKTKLTSEQTLLLGVKAAEGQLSIEHFIKFNTAMIESLDYMMSLAKKCEGMERIKKLRAEIEKALVTEFEHHRPSSD